MGRLPFTCLLVSIVDGVGISRLPRILTEAGCAVTLLGPKGLLTAKSRYIASHRVTGESPDELCSSLKDLIESADGHFDLVILGDENVLHAVAQNADQPWASQCLPAHGDGLEIVLSKHRFMETARLHGVAVPDSQMIDSLDDALRLAERFGYPLMLKKAHGFAGAGVRMAEDPQRLRMAYQQLDGGEIAMEKFVQGKLGLTETLFHRGAPIAWMSGYKLQCWPTPLSASAVRQFVNPPEIKSIVTRIGAMTGFSGFSGTDWIQDSNGGRLVVIEFNPRPTPGVHLGPYAGVDFPGAIRAILAGQPSLQEPSNSGSTIHMYPQALHLALEDHDLRAVARSLRDIPWDDRRLAVAVMRRIVTHYLPQRLRRSVNH